MAERATVRRIVLVVSDLERARTFYSSELGLPALREGPQYVDLDAGGDLTLVLRSPGPGADLPPVGILELEVSDVDAWSRDHPLDSDRLPRPPPETVATPGEPGRRRELAVLDPDRRRVVLRSVTTEDRAPGDTPGEVSRWEGEGGR